jgi:hypothetical protein
MDFDRPLDPPEYSGGYIYRIVRIEGDGYYPENYRSESDAKKYIEAMVTSRLAEYRAICEADADADSLEDGSPVHVFTDAELREDLRDEYEIIEERDEDSDFDDDDFEYNPWEK